MIDKPMIPSEATTAGAIRQSVGAGERCPGCGAPISYRNAVWEFAECGVHRPVTGGYWRGVTEKCLRRQLVQAQERERELRDLLRVHERQQAEYMAHNAQLRRVLEGINQFARAHHADQPGHVLLHALTVDIPNMCESALADLGREEDAPCD